MTTKRPSNKLTVAAKHPQTPAERQQHADVLAWAREGVTLQLLRRKVPDRVLPSRQTLEQPGQLELVIAGIETRFRLADQRHRECIDQEVMQCVRVADFLDRIGPAKGKILNGQWLKHLGNSSRGASESLRFVFLQVFTDRKRASFYYCATRALFEAGIDVKAFPAGITAGGGLSVTSEGKRAIPP